MMRDSVPAFVRRVGIKRSIIRENSFENRIIQFTDYIAGVVRRLLELVEF